MASSSFFDDESLISEVKNHAIIWDKRLKDNRNPKMVEKAWGIIAKNLNSRVDQLKYRWVNLRRSYVRYKAFKTKNADSSEMKTKSFAYSHQMSFLDKVIKHRSNYYKVEPGSPMIYPLELTLHSPDDDGNYVMDESPESPLTEFHNSTTPSYNQSPPPSPSQEFIVSNLPTNCQNTNSSSYSLEAKPTGQISISPDQSEVEKDRTLQKRNVESSASASGIESRLINILEKNVETLSTINEDPDRLFMLSLWKDLQALPPEEKKKKKLKIIQVLYDME